MARLPLYNILLVIPYIGSFSGAPITPALLRLDMSGDNLRDEPDFEKLYDEKQP